MPTFPGTVKDKTGPDPHNGVVSDPVLSTNPGKLGTSRCVILSGGEILDYGAVAALLRKEDFIICADSGYRHCGPLGVEARLLVGDFDSIGALPAGIPVVALPADKDYTDTALAAEEAVERGFRELFFTGLLGGRPDHSLANIQTMAGLSRRGIVCAATDGITGMQVFTAPLQGNSLTVPLRRGCYFSVLALSSACRRVTIQGGKYPLAEYDLRFDEARAVSNEFLEADVAVSLEEGTVLVMTTKKDG